VNWRATVLAVAYLALAELVALALAAYGAYDCYESCRYDVPNPPWAYDISAWQWDAILWLGVASGIASIAFVVTAFRFGARIAALALGVQLSLAAAGAVLVHAADEVDSSLAALVLAGLAALGSGLIAVRASPASFRAGGPDTRAGPSV
jgi:hypothetical protein